jgi:hypothetical protein
MILPQSADEGKELRVLTMLYTLLEKPVTTTGKFQHFKNQ